MGSPLSPIVANHFMEKFEKKSLETYFLKPNYLISFIDDMSVNWQHGDIDPNNFLNHLKNIFDDIKFIMENGDKNFISFLDILLLRKRDGSLRNKVLKKKAHINSYIHANLHHHLSQKMGVFNMLFTRALRILDKEHVDEEIEYLRIFFLKNGYKRRDINKAIKKAKFGATTRPPFT